MNGIASNMDTSYPNYFDYHYYYCWNEWGSVGQSILSAIVTKSPIQQDEATQKVVQQMVQ